MLFLFVFLVFCFVFYFLIYHHKARNYPPGPVSLPIIGNLWQIGSDQHKAFSKFKKIYGNIFSINLGSLRSVVLTDYNLMREAYNHPDLFGRPFPQHLLEPITGSLKGFLYSEGRQWLELRRFFMKNLKDFRIKSAEQILQREIREMTRELKAEGGRPIWTQKWFTSYSLNTLLTLIAGERYKSDDEEFIQLVKLHKQISVESKVFMTGFMFPWFIKYFPEFSGYNEFRKSFDAIRDIFRKKVENHKNTFQSNKQRDLIDFYLKEIFDTTDSTSSFYKESGEMNMIEDLMFISLIGIEDVTVAFVWVLLALAHNPKCQEKLHEEIKSVVGLDRLPTLQDKNKMPYTNAVFMEAWRVSTFVAINFRATTDNVEFHGYHIPKGTAVFSDYAAVWEDPEIWGDPANFRPERFIENDGETLKRHDAYIMFSFGKRSCPGEQFAKDQMFMLTAGLFQNFRVSFDPSAPTPTMEGQEGMFVIFPKPHKLIMNCRY